MRLDTEKLKRYMGFNEDILRKIHLEFGERSTEAIQLINDYIIKTNYLEYDRIIRSVVFLSEGKIAELNRYIEVAALDPRDIMLWAEYEKSNDSEKVKRVRDFSKPFND